ncbi:PTS glucose transporter subunit IIA [Clostridium botulinum]|uniref:PTS sugar transporter subunit IIA n=1 Tax=Clostridium botulinum TaxID=1491 RepID=UPI001A913C15|nr:PTS glucose transporter subunit IIA [Clostridium botulinum]MBO0524243.1 PTS glucose transporter subunit IIA [Clostridium botulinum]MBO0529574.1 PTS glucose transporter subunit IIA [Clostridium botulinum]MBO0530237.1 PTS glucose transporter subunit IIA [Clostridium botulinum]MBO0535049.1 PTS glucose transporter subunit IIA [Clostridium botulinum]MBO0538790.1 PTS glucose transporter subunit IIA [Clostridium botulinum]
MFSFFKRENKIVAPVLGRVLQLSEVPDKVFASKLAGDGVAIECEDNTIVAPANGVISLIFKTNHAFGITLEDGTELLVHIGIDTVKLEGKGFERLLQEGDKVRVGDPIIRIDREFIEAEGYSLITPVLITNPDNVKNIQYKTGFNASPGKDILIIYTDK